MLASLLRHIVPQDMGFLRADSLLLYTYVWKHECGWYACDIVCLVLIVGVVGMFMCTQCTDSFCIIYLSQT